MVKAGRWKESRDPYLVETSVPGVFACGDVRFSPVKRVASAVGEGSIAIAFVHQYLATPGGVAARLFCARDPVCCDCAAKRGLMLNHTAP